MSMTSIPSQASANLSATLAGAQLGQLQPGDVLSAIVAKVIDATTLQLLSAIGSFDVQSDLSLAAGTRVELAVAGTPAQPTFTLQSPAADPSAPKFAVAATLVSAKAIASPAPNASPAATASSVATDTPATTSAATTPRAATTPAAPTPVSEPAVQAAAAIVRDAAARQGGLAQLYADLGAVIAQPNLTVPKPVAAAIAQLLGVRLQTTSDGGVDAGDIRSALVRSGLVSADALPANGQRAAKTADLGNLLSVLRQALKNWAGAEADLPTAARLSQSAPGVGLPQAPNKSAAPMPPYRDSPTMPQALAEPSIPGGATAHETALYLLDKTDAAIARQTLLQIASLPDQPVPGAAHADATRVTFDIPLATPQGTAVAQIRIERDGRNAGDSGDSAPVWRASFSLDIEPIGPVHVRIVQASGKTAVSLNAERAESAASLNAGLAQLEAGLRNAELEPGTLSCRAGLPAKRSGSPGMFVDQPT
jgi:hypothetical protein